MKYRLRSGSSSSERRWPLRAQQLEDQQGRDRPRVGAVEVAEVVVTAHLAAECAALLAHARLEERVTDPVAQRGARRRFSTVSATARLARTS